MSLWFVIWCFIPHFWSFPGENRLSISLCVHWMFTDWFSSQSLDSKLSMVHLASNICYFTMLIQMRDITEDNGYFQQYSGSQQTLWMIHLHNHFFWAIRIFLSPLLFTVAYRIACTVHSEASEGSLSHHSVRCSLYNFKF